MNPLPPEVKEWQAEIAAKAARRRRARRLYIRLLVMEMALTLVCFAWSYSVTRSGPHSIIASIIVPLVALLFVFIQLPVAMALESRSAFVRDAVHRLSNLDDVRVVGALAEACFIEESPMLLTALARLLSRLTPRDAALLDADQRACLYRILQIRRADEDSDVQLAVLHALGQIGDRDARKAVTVLANARAKTAAQEKVWDAARACLRRLD